MAQICGKVNDIWHIPSLFDNKSEFYCVVRMSTNSFPGFFRFAEMYKMRKKINIYRKKLKNLLLLFVFLLYYNLYNTFQLILCIYFESKLLTIKMFDDPIRRNYDYYHYYCLCSWVHNDDQRDTYLTVVLVVVVTEVGSHHLYQLIHRTWIYFHQEIPWDTVE